MWNVYFRFSKSLRKVGNKHETNIIYYYWRIRAPYGFEVDMHISLTSKCEGGLKEVS